MYPTTQKIVKWAVLLACLMAFGFPRLCLAQKGADIQDRSVEAIPEADGVYRTDQGLHPSRLTKAAEATFPEREGAIEDGCAVVLVVGEDGKPSKIHVVYSPGKVFDESAIRAVEQSEFLPAYRPSLSHDHPVPSWVDVWVPFHADKQAAPVRLTSKLFPEERPTPLHTIEAQYAEKARKNKINGSILLTLLINPKGVPVDLHVVRGLGYGLDENALQAACQYRFKPAMKDGVPVPQRISLEISFHVY